MCFTVGEREPKTQMISEKQFAANRRNSQRSTGPRTEGRQKVAAMIEADRLMHEALSASVVETSRPKGAGEIQLPSASLPITAALGAAKVFNAEPKLSSSRPSTGSGSSAIFRRTSLRSGASRDKPSRDNKDGFVFSTTEIHAAIKRALLQRRVSNRFHPVQTQKPPRQCRQTFNLPM